MFSHINTLLFNFYPCIFSQYITSFLAIFFLILMISMTTNEIWQVARAQFCFWPFEGASSKIIQKNLQYSQNPILCAFARIKYWTLPVLGAW
jgi:hypothetical protein